MELTDSNKKIFLKGSAKVSPLKMPAHHLSIESRRPSIQQHLTIDDRRPSIQIQQPNTSMDESYEFANNVSYADIQMSTKDKGKEILQESPQFTESECEVEPEMSPRTYAK